MSGLQHQHNSGRQQLGFVVIGRNEGKRLLDCLESIREASGTCVYVDSGSTDDSVALAHRVGAEVIRLDRSRPFSAARARNAGFKHLRKLVRNLRYVQFIDGDCTLEPRWPDTAVAVLEAHPDVAAVCGLRRERFPEASIYNAICAVEWRLAATGSAREFGGDVLIRMDVLARAGGYDPQLIACEDVELALRIRANGGRIVRLEETSSHHDAAIANLSQWSQRAIRWGHGIAQLSAMHGGAPDFYYLQDRRRTWLFGGFIPIVALGFALPSQGLSLALLLLYPIQFHRLVTATRRIGISREARLWSLSCVAAQPANFIGMLVYHYRSTFGTGPRIIEYKGAAPRPNTRDR